MVHSGITFLIVLLSVFSLSAQILVTNKGDSVSLFGAFHGPDLIPSYNNDSVRVINYIDTNYNYTVEVPEWMSLINTEIENIFGGLFERVNGFKNAITIEAFNPEQYPSFNVFIYDRIDKYNSGDAMQGNPDLILNQKKRFPTDDPNRADFQIQITYYGDILIHKWIMVKTPHAWLHFTFNSTPETYPTNHDRFLDFFNGVKYH